MSDLVTERLSEWVTERLSDWATERLSDWATERLSDWATERLRDWVTEWLSDWVTEWLSDWVQVNARVIEWSSEWFSKLGEFTIVRLDVYIVCECVILLREYNWKSVNTRHMNQTYLTKSIVKFFGWFFPVCKVQWAMLHKQGLMKLFKCHPVLLQKQRQDRMKNKQIHLWFRNKYNEEKKSRKWARHLG